MPIEIDNPSHCDAFIRRNEQWISEHFALEEADRRLASDPFRMVTEGGHILSLKTEWSSESARCSAATGTDSARAHGGRPSEARQGSWRYDDTLMTAALRPARADRASSVYLLSNTVLAPAISLYRKCGFRTFSEGPHPHYARCNIVMELLLV